MKKPDYNKNFICVKNMNYFLNLIIENNLINNNINIDKLFKNFEKFFMDL